MRLLLTLLFLFTPYLSPSWATPGDSCARTLAIRAATELPTQLKIVKTPDPILQQVAKPVPLEFLGQPEFSNFLYKMIQFRKNKGGVGLAAPQIGVPLRVAVIRPPQFALKSLFKPMESELVLINPVITPGSKQIRYGLEGCLSISNACRFVPRFKSIQVNYIDQNGHPQEKLFSDFTAVIVQHEVDHLDGILFTDISSKKHKTVGLRKDVPLTSPQRYKLIQFLTKIKSTQPNVAEAVSLMINEDLISFDDPTVPLNYFSKMGDDFLTDSFIDDLIGYYEELIQRQGLSNTSFQ